MTRPREVIANRTYLVTRRCTQRQFLLRPDDATNNAIVYCLAVAAQRTNIDVVFTCAMSNHHHTIVHDHDGRLPEFMEHFHRLLAKCQNLRRRRWENFWDSAKASAVRLLDADDIIAKIVYAATNPVKDFLVERAHQWPGVNGYRALVRDEPMTAKRPRYFFNPNGEMPSSVSLPLVMPANLGTISDVATRVVEAVAEVEATVLAIRRQTQRGVLGRKAVLAQSWREAPKSVAARRKMSPQLAARDKWRRIETLLQTKYFLVQYRRALDAMAAFVPIPFPLGTYWLRRFLNVDVGAYL
ncbi:MAG: hypothetical protein IPL79_08855 [Myxococcales bacterium]|nr:hypothetical protein [Myxococcales bacterium]